MIRITSLLSRRRNAQPVSDAVDVDADSDQAIQRSEPVALSVLPRPDAAPMDLGFSHPANNLLRQAEHQFGGERAYRLAFSPSQPVVELHRLAGRTEIITRIIRSIEDLDLHVIVYGTRGIGKTSLLRVVQGLAEKAEYMVHYVSCGPSASFCEVFRSLANRIPLLYDRASDPTGTAAEKGRTLADRLPDGDFSVSQLTDVLSAIQGVRVLLVLDEFDRSEARHFRQSIGELIKNLSDRLIRVQLLIGGVAGNITDLVTQIPSIQRNIVGIAVPNLNAGETMEMLDIAESHGHVRFDEPARRHLIEASAGLPYLVGLLGQHAVRLANDDDSTWISDAHVRRAITQAADDIESRLSLQSTHAIRKMLSGPQAPLLVRAAAAEVHEGGMVVDQDIVAGLEAGREDFQILLRPIADDPRNGWRFLEDGAAGLVWLRVGSHK